MLFVILVISLIVKGKQRKFIQGLAILYMVSFGILYFVRPYWIDMQLEKKIGYIQNHLERQYLEET